MEEKIMFDFFVQTCRQYPELVLFLAIGIGYYVGKIKFFGFNLGSTASVLLVSLVLGQIGLQIADILQQFGFALFIFAIGYKVGPQFFGALKKEGLHYIWISLVVAITGLITAISLGKIFNFDPGTAAGLLAGAMTQSSTIGVADGAISQLSISAAQKALFQNNVAIAYAITYIFGTAGLILFFKLVPKLMGLNLKAEAEKLEREMSGGSDDLGKSPELFAWYKQINLRAYQVTNNSVIGKPVKEIEKMFPAKVAIEKIKRGEVLLEVKPETIIQTNDLVALVGSRQSIIKAIEIIGREIDDKKILNLIGEIIDVCVLKKEAAGKTLGEISQQYGHGIFLRRITRAGHEIPLARNLVLKRGDVLQIAGTQGEVEKAVKLLGYAERPTNTTDLVMVGWGCVLGILLGLISIPIMGIPITLGVGGGVLVSGLLFGWLRAMHPTFGQIPEGAQWIFTDLGLNLFIASIGLSAGPAALKALQTTGLSVFFAGVILTLTPMIIGLIFGRYILKLNPVLLFGALTGAGTITAALNSVKEEADSAAPVLGYTVPYAFGNVLLTIWGTVIVNFLR